MAGPREGVQRPGRPWTGRLAAARRGGLLTRPWLQLCSGGPILSALERQCLYIQSEVWGEKMFRLGLCNVPSYQCPPTIAQVVGGSLWFLEHVFLGRQEEGV